MLCPGLLLHCRLKSYLPVQHPHSPHLMASFPALAVRWEHNVQTCIELFPSLERGLDINVRFTGVDSFEFTKELSVFDIFDVEYAPRPAPPPNAHIYKRVSTGQTNLMCTDWQCVAIPQNATMSHNSSAGHRAVSITAGWWIPRKSRLRPPWPTARTTRHVPTGCVGLAASVTA